MNTIVWFRIWFLSVTPFGIFMAVGLLAMYLLTVRTRRFFRGLRKFSAADSMLCAVPCGLIGAKLFHWIFSFGSYSFWEALALWRGGYAICGAWIGFAAGLALYCRRHRFNTMDALDCFAPGFAAFVAIERFAERFTDQGIGKEVDTGFLQNTLFTVRDMYDSSRHSVSRLELVSALIALVVVILFFQNCRQKKFRLRGEAIRLVLLMITVPQVVWESMRDDAYLCYGFVRVSQVASMACALALTAYYMNKWRRTGISFRTFVIYGGIALAGAILCVVQEFAVDTNGNLEWNYLLMWLGTAMILYPALHARSVWTAINLKRFRRAQAK